MPPEARLISLPRAHRVLVPEVGVPFELKGASGNVVYQHIWSRATGVPPVRHVSVFLYHAHAGIQFTPALSLFLREALGWMPAALAFSVPFAFAGFMLGTLLADPTLPARRIYGFDLLGSALGAFIVIPAVRALGVERALLVACVVLLVGTVALVRPRRRATHVLVASAAAIALFASARARLSDRPRRTSIASTSLIFLRASAGLPALASAVA